MYKKLFILFTLLGLSINNAMAGNLLLKVSPLHKLSTCSNKVFEGDIVKFKVVEDNDKFKKDDIITGTILNYKPNGFNGEEANLTIGNLRNPDGKKINGEIYLSGNMHKVYQEYLNGLSSDLLALPLIRGGEIKVKANQTITILLTDNKKYQEKVPVRIKPVQKISTTHNETQTSDVIRFKVINDVYVNNNLYIKKDSPIIGYVDYVQDNGWDYDNAQIDIKKFKTRDVNNNIVEINSELSINGFEILKYKSNRPAQFFNYIGVYFRGKEVEICPEKDKNIFFNIWLTK